jgi:hypothetical protein
MYVHLFACVFLRKKKKDPFYIILGKKVRTVPSNMSKICMSKPVRPVTSVPRTDLSSWSSSRSLNKVFPLVYGMIPG